MAGFGLGLITGFEVEHLIKNALTIQGNAQALEAIEQSIQSCAIWANGMKQLVENLETIQHANHRVTLEDGESYAKIDLVKRGEEGIELWNHLHEEMYAEMAKSLREGKVVIAEMKLPMAVGYPRIIDHYFVMEPVLGGTHVRTFHAWQGRHNMLISEPIEIEEIINSFSHLTSHDWVGTENPDVAIEEEIRENNFEASKEAFKNIFGEQDADVPMQIAEKLDNEVHAPRSRPLIGLSKADPIFFPGEDSSEQLARFIADMDHPVFFSPDGDLIQITRADFHDAVEEFEIPESLPVEEYATEIEAEAGSSGGHAMGSVFGLVFGVGSAVLQGKNAKDTLMEGLKGLTAGAAGDLAGLAVSRQFGESVLRDNIVTGVAMTAVFTLWDVHEWKMHEITAVEFREHMAEALGGVAGGVIGMAAAGAVAGVEGGPIGMGIGFLAGLIGGVIGANVGREVDHWIWDQGEDDVMNCYEFFGWFDVERNTRPEKSAEEFGEAFETAVHEKKHEDCSEHHWYLVCLRNFMVLVGEMYPETKEIFKLMHEVAEKSVDSIPFAMISTASASPRITIE